MRKFLAGVCVAGGSAALLIAAQGGGGGAQAFVGRWDVDVPSTTSVGANWLGVTDKGDGKLEIWFQPTGGHVHPVAAYEMKGDVLHLTIDPVSEQHPPMTWDVKAEGDTLHIKQARGDRMKELTGVRAPKLDRPEPKQWKKPEAIFNGKNLDGWVPIGDPAKSHWVAKDGVLLNQEHGANLKTTRAFDDFKLHFEVKCPDKANSGVYLRGRYELQMEYEPENSEPNERSMGAIYGRLGSEAKVPRTPNEWETFDVTLVGRTVTVVRNGVKTIDRKQIDGITGGALNADEGKPGPFYLQGDHTGGLMFRNITVATPVK